MGGRRCDVLSQCKRTTIQSPFLEALLSGETKNYYPGEWASNFLTQGHGRIQPARQALCYILRQALGIVRMPNTYDVKIRANLFDNIDPSDLDFAVEDARRIYEFTQAEMNRVWAKPTITLKRGIRDQEAGVARALFDELGSDNETVPLYFSSLTFFNYVSGAFNAPLVVSVPCPIEWIWASQYTLADLEQGQSCEEFVVACLDPRATMELPASAFDWAETWRDIPEVRITGVKGYPDTPESRRHRVAQALSYLTQEGLEPDDGLRLGIEYEAGKWEGKALRVSRKLVRLGQKLDRRFSSSIFQSTGHIRPRRIIKGGDE